MNQTTKGMLAVMAGNSIFGFSFLFSKIALQITIPAVLIATRFTIAFLILNLIALVGRNMKKKDGDSLISFSLKGKPLKPVLLLALFQPVIYFISENYGIMYTSSAFAGTIIAVIPIAGIIFDVILMHSSVQRKQIICAICSVGGVALTSLGAEEMKSSVKGMIFLLIAVMAGSLFFVATKRAADYYNPLERTYVMFAVGSVVYIVIALLQAHGKYDDLILGAYSQAPFWISIIYLSVVSSVCAFLLLNYGSNYVTVSQGTMFANVSTVISIFAGVFILGESFTISQVIGAAVILVCVYIASI